MEVDIIKVITIFRLGLFNTFRVLLYRLKIRFKSYTPVEIKYLGGEVFSHTTPIHLPTIAVARQSWVGSNALYFGLPKPFERTTNGVPNWFAISGKSTCAPNNTPWWLIQDFSREIGDIKVAWELSRFDWVLVFAQHSALGDTDCLAKLNAWIADWSKKNQPNLGVNWKCGQEASIRVMHLVLAALLLGQADQPTLGLRAIVHLHLERIAPTIGYAIGQANNHGTSEAAALYIGGHFLGGSEGKQWAKTGLHWLENRARVLIETDGTFSQYSVNYHRVMLDSYALAEVWRRYKSLPVFSDKCHERLVSATNWLAQMVDKDTGDAPNFGANDGAQLTALTDCGYRDYRPSVQLATVLFCNKVAYTDGPWDQQLLWFGLEKPKEHVAAPSSATFDQGGFHVLRSGPATAYLRYPRFKFRPSQADALHCDLWINGENILRDAGTFSYNVSEPDTAYFNGTVAHNTVEFDGRDQMPRLGRFLFGRWLKSEQVEPVSRNGGGVSAGAGYRDYLGAQHHRQLRLTDTSMIIRDEVSGFKSKAVLRWRLIPGDWDLQGSTLSNGKTSLHISTTMDIHKITLTDGYESRYYLEKTLLPVLEIEVNRPGVIVTKLRF